eukprot:GEMP01044545.1.p1 GENE.GEMP01044545.1~~GEMP01044545.1.p1  ORF type:complete len:254 (+),score=52.65 GEMP01044545.1:74-835(+)
MYGPSYDPQMIYRVPTSRFSFEDSICGSFSSTPRTSNIGDESTAMEPVEGCSTMKSSHDGTTMCTAYPPHTGYYSYPAWWDVRSQCSFGVMTPVSGTWNKMAETSGFTDVSTMDMCGSTMTSYDGDHRVFPISIDGSTVPEHTIYSRSHTADTVMSGAENAESGEERPYEKVASDETTTAWDAASAPNNSQIAEDHKNGKCQPCAYFFHKADGCRMADECRFCHLCGPEVLRSMRKDKAKRAKRELRKRMHNE